ncbi:MAG TPA: TonB-dependent siderophore receptor [Tahibacter sp.]|uniref:TonB-dependent siderophore receptor n=1 Tax=Tahibacter sp. TaxID=2056211 RepID=UPI002B8D6A6D|nr:TonB-dependent siderophore receptor [Tahibacter sp.]HSX59512.1 TonB-dependent siderophore receptor [Tahibacter sp.]
MTVVSFAALPRRLRPTLGIAAALAATVAAAAATATGADEATSTLETVNVTAPIVKETDTVTKTDTPIVEIPQSISVVSAEQMRERAIHGIEEAVWYTAGAQGGGYGEDSRSDWLLVRGFTPARYLDGLALPDGSGTGITRIEPYGLQQLEVLKGPSSVVYGAMPPGGMVNLVSKRPTETAQGAFEVQAGSFNLRQAALDVGGPLNAEGTLLYRLTALARNSDTSVDHIKDDRYYIAPALTWLPGEATSFTLLSRYQKAETASGGGFLPAAGTLLPNPNGRIPRNRFTGEPGQNDYDKDLSSIGYEFRHAFANGVAFRQNLRYGKADIDPSAGIGAFGLAEDQRTLNRYYFPNEEHSKTFGVDNNLQWSWGTGRVRHDLLAGLDYRRSRNDYASAFAFGAPSLDIFNPVYGSPITIPAYTSHTDQTQHQTGIYLQDQLSVDRWLLTIGLRQDWVDTDTDDRIANTRSTQKDDKLSGRVGLSYRFDSGFVPYLAYSESFQPTVGSDFEGRAFVPTTGEQIEGGLKFQPANGNGLVTLALFTITQQNAKTVDPNHTLFQVQQGETKLRGIELEGRWNIGRGLSIYGAYTHTDSEVTQTTDLPSLGKEVALVPRRQASAGFDYTLTDGALAGLGFGAGVRHVGDHYGDSYNLWKTPSYTLLDLAVHYDFDAWRAQVNASNLGDKEYISVCNSAFWCYYGYERNVTATLRYQW